MTTAMSQRREAEAELDYSVEPSIAYEATRADIDFFRGNTAIPDNTFGPDEERIFIDDDPFELEEASFAFEHKDTSRPLAPTSSAIQPSTTRVRHHHGTDSTLSHPHRYASTHTTFTRPPTDAATPDEIVVVTQPEPSASSVASRITDSERTSSETDADGSRGDVDGSSAQDSVAAHSLSPSVESADPSPSPEDGLEALSESTVDTDGDGSSLPTQAATHKEKSRGDVKTGKDMMRNVNFGLVTVPTAVKLDTHASPIVLGGENLNQQPTIGAIGTFSKGKLPNNTSLKNIKM